MGNFLMTKQWFVDPNDSFRRSPSVMSYDREADKIVAQDSRVCTLGALTNIDQAGFASVAFHSFPSTLKWDAYSGDYGPNFFGHALNTATGVRH